MNRASSGNTAAGRAQTSRPEVMAAATIAVPPWSNVRRCMGVFPQTKTSGVKMRALRLNVEG
jgi:hypothetical protein